MASAVESGFQRSEALQKEWDALKLEMDRVMALLSRRHNDRHAMRKEAIEARMRAITLEMSEVLSAARAEVPPMAYDVPEDDDDDSSLEQEEQSSIKQDQKMARHEVMRTYDSTDSEGEGAFDLERAAMILEAKKKTSKATVENLPPAAKTTAVRGGDVSCSDEDDIVEDSGGGKGAVKLLRGLKGALKAAGEKTTAVIPSVPRTRALTDDECDDLRLELSRLERQARKLKRKTDRTEEDEEETKATDARLAVIAAQLASGTVDLTNAGQGNQNGRAGGDATRHKAPLALFGGRGKNKERHRASPRDIARSSPCASSASNMEDHDDFDDAPIEDEEPYEAPVSKAKSTFDQSVKSMKAFGLKTFGGKGEGGLESPSTRGKSLSPLAGRGGKDGGASMNPFVQVTDKLAKRGERLGALENRADEMTDNATEMHSAAANLRKRQQKSASFFR
jgi:hypothetical protein